MSKKSKNNEIILDKDLSTYFYEELEKINSKFTSKLSKESVFYSSLVMEKYLLTNTYFEMDEGKIRNKILGEKYLSCLKQSDKIKKRELIDIGDTALMLCGFFHKSINSTILDISYYENLGKMAYSNLNGLSPKAYQINEFYKKIADSFSNITKAMSLITLDDNSQLDRYLLVVDKVS